jgi:hypothetical protein
MNKMCVECTENTYEKCASKCLKCQFYEVKTDFCTIKNITEYTKDDVENCKDFLIKDKLVMY